jgi:hypothetical protein
MHPFFVAESKIWKSLNSTEVDLYLHTVWACLKQSHLGC